MPLFANARMYSLNPALAQAWRVLLQWVMDRAEVDGEVIDYPAPQPLPALWSRADMGCAFMCGYPLARAFPQPVVLAAPLPSPARYGGRPVYCTDLVACTGSAIATLDDARGRRMAFTTADSMSGYQAPRRFFAPSAATRGSSLFAATVGPLITPRAVVDALIAGDADIGPLDSYAHDLLRLHEPQLVAQLRVVASTPLVPIPPLAGAPSIDPAAAHRLSEALLAVASAPGLAPQRAALLLRGFARVSASAYHANLAAADEADALGYPRLA